MAETTTVDPAAKAAPASGAATAAGTATGDGKSGAGAAADGKTADVKPDTDAGTILGGDPKAAEDAAAKAGAQGADKPEDKKTDSAGKPGEADPANKDGAAKDNPQGAPEKYADFKLPEGVKANETALKEFPVIAKALNLTQEAAQKLVDFQTQMIVREREEALAHFKQLTGQWTDECKKAFGPNYEQEFQTASKAIERFGPPELRKILNDTGMGSHPAFLKFANAVGKAISEDHLAEGSEANPTAKKSDAEVFYGGTMGKKGT